MYTYGYVSGTIGPASLDEPHNFVRGRVLGGSDLNAVNLIPFVVRTDKKTDIRTLLADVGNAFGRSDDDTGYNNAYLGDAVCVMSMIRPFSPLSIELIELYTNLRRKSEAR